MEAIKRRVETLEFDEREDQADELELDARIGSPADIDPDTAAEDPVDDADDAVVDIEAVAEADTAVAAAR